MSQQGEAAEQIVNMATNVTVKGVECATNLAGKGALSLATFLIAVLKDQKRTKGKARMKAFNGNLTQNMRIGLDGRKHRRNLNVLVVGGSGAGKTRFYAKPSAPVRAV